MKKKIIIKNIVITLSIIVLLIISLNSKAVYAENTSTNTATNTVTNTENKNENTNKNIENNTSEISNTPTNSSGTTNNNKKITGTKKSSNANLSNLGIKPNDFKGFKAQTTTYNVTVPTDVESVTIYANAQDSKAKVSGVGKQNLKSGDNKFDVVVTAEDGTTKTYTLNITKDTSSQNTENVPDKYTGDGLSSLNIENLELNPSFDTQKYEYSVKYFGEKEKLDINATATDPYYTIEITGNEKLIEGENIINILVSDPDGNNVAIYQITVNKALVDEEAVAKEKQEKQKRIILIIAGTIAGILIIVIIIVIIRKRRKRRLEYYEEDEIEENDLNQLEDYDDNYREEIEFDKEEARKSFLDNYNNKSIDLNEDIDSEIENKKKHKGKRFK